MRRKIDCCEIVVVDRDPGCQAAALVREVDGASLVTSDWTAFGRTVWSNESDWSEDLWVPAPIAPHIAVEWLTLRLRDANWDVTRSRGTVPEVDMPFAMVLESGSVALSHAPGVCPSSCIEPRKCPLTGGDRDWEMSETVNAGVGGEVLMHRCRHLTFGVGVIPLAEFYRGAAQALGAAEFGVRSFAVATVSSCHGLVDVLKITPREMDVEQTSIPDV